MRVIIRREQMEIFDAASRRAFEDSTYLHLQEYFPTHCERLGEPQMRLVIAHGWKKAQSHGLTEARCVRSYIEFMCQLGSDFDTDTLLPWAEEILNERSSLQISRADRLYERVWDYLDHVEPDYESVEGKRVVQELFPKVRQTQRDSSEYLKETSTALFCEALGQRLAKSFARKSAYVGTDTLQRSLKQAIETGRTFGVTSTRGATLIAVMRFVLGAGFACDPLLPWVSSILLDETVTDQSRRVDNLYAACVSNLDHWWNISTVAGEQSDGR